MVIREVTVQLPEGLHMKAAGDFSQLANKFKSSIAIEANGRCADGKSLLGLLSLGTVSGTRLAVCAEGPDEETAVQSLTEMAISE